jgi:hypothetical protein
VPCSALLASVDVISSLEASLLATFHRPLSPELLLAVLCQRVLQIFLRSSLASSGVWCCRSCRLGSAVRVMSPARGCFAVLALADALPPLLLGLHRACDALCLRMLCRVGPGGCFAAVSSFLGGCFATTASPPLLAVFCVVFFLAGFNWLGCGGGPSLFRVSFFRVFCSKPLSLWFGYCALGSPIASCKPFFDTLTSS